MERLNLATKGSATTTLEDGTEVDAAIIEESRPTPGPVAEHEAAHVVAAGQIVSATIIASGDALGSTTPVVMTPAAAAAAEAIGSSGTDWDMFLVEEVMGVSRGSAIAAASSALSGQGELRHEVAVTMQELGTIGQSHVERAKQRVKERSLGIFPISLVIISADGQKREVTTKSFRNEVRISDLMLPHPKAA